MGIEHAVITAAGPGQHRLPLQRIVDRRGRERTVLELLIDDIQEAGIERICLVVRPGDESAYRQAAGDRQGSLDFAVQSEPRGYGHAVLMAESFVEGDSFLHLVGDHLFLSATERGCVRQLLEVAEREACGVSAVVATRETQLRQFGTIGGRRTAHNNRLVQVERILEKPTPTQAEQELVIAGLRAGFYLCFFGVHVLPPRTMQLLREASQTSNGSCQIELSPILDQIARQERFLALEVQGTRYNLGVRYGMLQAQLAVALSGDDRDSVLNDLLELLAASRGESRTS